MTLLSVEKLDKTFGGLRALKQVSFEVQKGAIFGLIGPNGAGKTTLFNVITGVYSPDGGAIRFEGASIGGETPAKVARRGIARTFQNIRLFRSMSVEENVMVAGHHLHESSMLSAMFRTKAHAADEARLRARARELLDVMGLGKHAG